MKTDSNKSLSVSFKAIVTRVATATLLAGAVLFAAPSAASAQGLSVQFGVGHPYERPFYGPGFYEERRREEWQRHEEWVRHQEWERHERWERDHAFHGRPPAYGYYGR